MSKPAIKMRLECSPDVEPLLAELKDIVLRRVSFPEFRSPLLEIVEALPDAFETLRIDGEDGAAPASDVSLVVKFRQSFLDLAATLRALDRDFDAGRQVHGASA